MAAAAAEASGPSCSSAAAAAGAGAAGVSEWLVLRDGCMRCDADGLHSLSYHPALNAILAVTSRGTIKVIDGTSGATLQASALSAKPGGQVKCQYISAVDKVIFVDDYAVGCRKDLNGILLLDTALQTPVSKQDDVVQLELPVTEAQQLLSACIEKIDVSSTEGYDLFITQLKDGLKNTSHETAANHKVAKWATVTFHLPHHVLKSIASAIVNELKKINQNVAALPVASSVMDRLSYLLPSARPELGVGPGRSVDRALMYSEANRRETFTSWPHVGYRWAQPDPMAQAGFYHQIKTFALFAIKDPQDTITSLILLPPDILDNREDDCEEPAEEMQLASKNGIEREKKSDISTLGHLVVTTQGGYVKVLDLSNFEILAKVEPPKKEGTEEQDTFVPCLY